MTKSEPMEPTSGSAPMPSSTAGTEQAAPHDQPSRTGTYELMAIFPATIADEEAPKVSAKLNALITSLGGSIVAEEDLGKRKLAYPIKHVRQGFYRLYQFDGPRSMIAKLDQELRLSADVLRHLTTVRTVKTPEQLEAEQALRERIQAKRIAAVEQAAASERKVKEEARLAEEAKAPQPTREVSKAELEQKLEEILTDESMGE